MVIDRAPYLGDGEVGIIQSTLDTIYAARYPHCYCRQLDVVAKFKNQGYELLIEFKSIDSGDESSTRKKFIVSKQKINSPLCKI